MLELIAALIVGVLLRPLVDRLIEKVKELLHKE